MLDNFENWICTLNRDNLQPLSSIASYINGLAMQNYRPKIGNGLPVIKIKEMNNGISNETERCNENIDKTYLVNNGDILFAWSGTLCLSIWCGGTAGLNQHIFKVVSDRYPKWFYYFWTNHYLQRFITIAKGKATTMGHIKRKELDLVEVIIPTQDELNKMNSIMNPLLERFINNKVENQTLSQLRDTLLPKLMNGVVDLDNVEI